MTVAYYVSLLVAFGIGSAIIVLAVYQWVQTSLSVYRRKPCPHCNRVISLVADFCPDCGKAFPFSTR